MSPRDPLEFDEDPYLIAALAAIIFFAILGWLWFGLPAAHGHEWYPKECCSEHDCKPVPCSEITLDDKQYTWHERYHWLHGAARMSPDGQCHVCIDFTRSYCIFIPGGTS